MFERTYPPNFQPDAGFAPQDPFPDRFSAAEFRTSNSRFMHGSPPAAVPPTAEKTDLLSRMSDIARPPPVGPSRGTNHKTRGVPAKPRGRGGGGRPLALRLGLEHRIG